MRSLVWLRRGACLAWIVALCAWTSTSSCGTRRVPSSQGPNVVLVVVDTLRADRLSQYGHARDTSPALERLAQTATRYARCYAPAPSTSPSTATILSGLLPMRHGTLKQGHELLDGAATLAECLARAGWRTAAFSHNHNVSPQTGFDQGFERFEAFDGRATAYPDVSELVQGARAWLDEDGDERFFLYLHAMNAHGPYLVPDARRDALLGRPPRGGFTYYGPTMSAIMREGDVARRAEVGDAMLASLAEQYDTAVRYTTDTLGELFAELETRGLWDRSLVIVTADHGEELFDHGGFSHGYSLAHEVLHVPLFVKWPGQRTGQVVETPVSLADVMPTVLAALDLEAPYALDGEPLPGAAPRASLAQATAGRPLLLQSEWRKRCHARGILVGDHKLVWTVQDYQGRRDVIELFDVAADPAETRDLSLEQPERVRALLRRMQHAFGAGERGAIGVARDVTDELDQDVLRALGYL